MLCCLFLWMTLFLFVVESSIIPYMITLFIKVLWSLFYVNKLFYVSKCGLFNYGGVV